jgi:hypothetical protein
MAKAGFSEAEGNALNAVVRGIIERAIASLQGVGLSHEGALHLLLLQSAIRTQDKPELRRLLKSIEDGGFADDGGGEPHES